MKGSRWAGAEGVGPHLDVWGEGWVEAAGPGATLSEWRQRLGGRLQGRWVAGGDCCCPSLLAPASQGQQPPLSSACRNRCCLDWPCFCRTQPSRRCTLRSSTGTMWGACGMLTWTQATAACASSPSPPPASSARGLREGQRRQGEPAGRGDMHAACGTLPALPRPGLAVAHGAAVRGACAGRLPLSSPPHPPHRHPDSHGSAADVHAGSCRSTRRSRWTGATWRVCWSGSAGGWGGWACRGRRATAPAWCWRRRRRRRSDMGDHQMCVVCAAAMPAGMPGQMSTLHVLQQ